MLERFEPTVPKVAELLEEAEEDLLAFYRRYLPVESIALVLEDQGDDERKEVVELQAA